MLMSAKGVVDCTSTADWCGETPLVPFEVLAVVTLTAGVASTVVSLRRSGTPGGR